MMTIVPMNSEKVDEKVSVMYSLKPVINHDTIIEHPPCMYEMKNIHGDGDAKQKLRIVSVVKGHFIDSIKAPEAEVAALEVRQEKILAQLAELKEQVFSLVDVLRENYESGREINDKPKKTQTAVHEDFVLNVNPSKPCFSLLALNKLWKDIDLRLTPFVHSSIRTKVPENFKINKSSSSSSIVNISLIWKDVIDAELIISGIQNSSVMGEINFLRYLSRVIDNNESTLKDVDLIKIDRVLDLSYQLSFEESAKDKQKILTNLNDILGTNEWFSGKKYPVIADVAAWSSIKQLKLKNFPTNLTLWFQKCEKIFLN